MNRIHSVNILISQSISNSSPKPTSRPRNLLSSQKFVRRLTTFSNALKTTWTNSNDVNNP
jgi:hypothetical protein